MAHNQNEDVYAT